MRKLTWVPSVALLIAACGGGGGGGGNNPGGGVQPPPPTPSPPPTAISGRFKDSNVSGLAYSTASQSGTTDELGTFEYAAGESVEFSVGAVVIGSAQGGATITPIDLVAGSTLDNMTVNNIARFFMLLDQNEDPEGGIEISNAVQNAASNWSQPDFSSTTFANDIATIVSDVASVDNRAATLPTPQAAMDHLEATERCLMSGLYFGQMAGSISGDLWILVYPGDGQIKAIYPGSLANFESPTAAPIDRQREFRVVSNSSANDSIEGTFDSYNELSGVYTVGTDTGTFSATRELNDPNAVWRYTGEYYTGSVRDRLEGLTVFNVDANGELAGLAPLVIGNRYETAGSIDGDQIVSRVTSSGSTFTGTVDEDLNTTFSGINSNGQTVLVSAKGCRLN